MMICIRTSGRKRRKRYHSTVIMILIVSIIFFNLQLICFYFFFGWVVFIFPSSDLVSFDLFVCNWKWIWFDWFENWLLCAVFVIMSTARPIYNSYLSLIDHFSYSIRRISSSHFLKIYTKIHFLKECSPELLQLTPSFHSMYEITAARWIHIPIHYHHFTSFDYITIIYYFII